MKKIDIRKLGIAWAIAYEARLNFKTTMQLDDPETPENEGIRNIANYLENIYFHEHADALESFGITDIKHMTPKQAVLLASYIPIERIEYSQAQIQWLSMFNAEAQLNDSVPIDKLFEWDHDKSGNGVCRNYAAVAIWVLEAIKMLQEPSKSLLHNTYALNLQDDYTAEEVPGNVDNHAWNWFINISEQKDGTHLIEWVVLDSTWADSSSMSSDPARIWNNEVKLDYSKERFFTLVQKFEEIWVLPLESYVSQLWESYKTSPSLEWKNLQGEVNNAIWPARLYIGYKILYELDTTPSLNENLQNIAKDFFVLFVQDLLTYSNNLDNIKANIGLRKLILKVLSLLWLKMNTLIDLSNKLKLSDSTDEKVKNAEKNFTNIIDNLQNYENRIFVFWLNDNTVFLADKIRNTQLLRTELKKLYDSRTERKDSYENELLNLYSKLSKEWQQIMLEFFTDLEVWKLADRSEKIIIEKRIEDKYNYYVYSSIYGKDQATKDRELAFLSHLEWLMASFDIRQLWPEKATISLYTKESKVTKFNQINLSLWMNDKQIKEQFEEHIKRKKNGKKYHK